MIPFAQRCEDLQNVLSSDLEAVGIFCSKITATLYILICLQE